MDGFNDAINGIENSLYTIFQMYLNDSYSLGPFSEESLLKRDNEDYYRVYKALKLTRWRVEGFARAMFLAWVKEKKSEQANEVFVPTSNRNEHSNEENKLTHKQQILLLDKLGLFDLPVFGNLNEIQKGKLVGLLLNRSPDNSENYIRYRFSKKEGEVSSQYFLHTPQNLNKIEKALKEADIKL